MQFESFAEFIAMGGHGFYVWLAYAVALLALVGMTVSVITKQRKVLAELRWAATVQAEPDSGQEESSEPKT